MAENKKNRTAAIILAAGSGTRMRADITKQRMLLCGTSVLLRSVLAFDRCTEIDELVVVGKANELDHIREEIVGRTSKPIKIVVGGDTRAESARCGYLAASCDVTMVAIHDAARPLISSEDILRVVARAFECGAATASASVTDTIKSVDSEGWIVGNIPRDRLIRAQTPQVFRSDWYREALEHLHDVDLREITDDNLLIAMSGHSVYAVEVGEYNMKITEPGDISRAELILRERGEC